MNRRLRVVVTIIVFLVLVFWINARWQIDPEEIRIFITSFGWKAPFLFIILYALTPFFFFPASLLSLTAGITYGIWPGVLFIWIGATVAASAGYVIGKFLGTKVASLREIETTARFQERVSTHGFLFVLILRLIPLIGFGMLNYLSGWLHIRFRSYVTATMVGILPGTIAYVTVGAGIVSGNLWMVAAAIVGAGVFISIVYFHKNNIRNWLGFPEKKGKD
ncbi:TVP38/TMEM64 family protein [Salimicrobium flavidum]|uniref:TVP38/TMEM64 family membrane protein n=1 Tax=Salimicrobium flavidum TaxID=570947 RepID=A0A1N7J9H7_9BACI|nr:VTT domain-containing protein [Salimicrobium flavidum]SIS45876.1 Uncharacterized membrane protein YdjX, TVP38/TMEM64 family, SNARE-associated domain [Salimicrobium flavidum]